MVDVVSKKVALLIKGIQDKSRLARKGLSNKEIKAQELISKGYNIKYYQKMTSWNYLMKPNKRKPPLAVCAK